MQQWCLLHTLMWRTLHSLLLMLPWCCRRPIKTNWWHLHLRVGFLVWCRDDNQAYHAPKLTNAHKVAYLGGCIFRNAHAPQILHAFTQIIMARASTKKRTSRPRFCFWRGPSSMHRRCIAWKNRSADQLCGLQNFNFHSSTATVNFAQNCTLECIHADSCHSCACWSLLQIFHGRLY